MFHIDNKSGVVVMPPVKEKLSDTPLFFTEGGNGVPPSWPGADWFNIVQSELLNILLLAGVVPDKADSAQIAGLIGGLARTVTWSGFSGGADPTGVKNSDAAFAAAAASIYDVYIPPGIYKITVGYSGNFICASEVLFVGGGYVLLKSRPLWSALDAPSTIQRFSRIAVGDTAFQFEGGRNTPVLSWLGKKDYIAPNGTQQPNLGWIEKNARGTSFASEGSIGWAAAAHSLYMLNGGVAIGLIGVGVNDNEANPVSVWALYLDAKRFANAPGTTWGAEIAVANHGPYVAPESTSLAKAIGMALMAGADPKINGLTDDCTQAIGIGNNGAKWGAGVNFGSSSLRIINEAGLEPYMRALLLRGSQRIGWEESDGKTLNFINAKGTDPLQRTGIILRNRTVDIDGYNFRMMRITHADGDTGSLRIFNGGAANPVVRVGTEGLADCSLQLEATGLGEVIVNKNLRPNVANGLKCGVTAFPWSGGATQTAFAITSDARFKTLIDYIRDVLLDIWAELQYKTYKLSDRVEIKGDDARVHVGLLTQDVDAAFAKHGEDARDYALFCYDEWDDQFERVHLNQDEMVMRTRKVPVPKTTEMEIGGKLVMVPVGHYEKRVTQDGETDVWVCEYEEVDEEYEDFADPVYEQRLILPAGNRYSLRYEEAYALEAALQRRNYERLLAKHDALEARISSLENQGQSGV